MKKNQQGFSILELVLAAGLFSVFAAGISLAAFQGMNFEQKAVQIQTARQWAEEGIEAARAIRSQSFDALADTDGSGLNFSDGKWSLTSDHDSWEGYTRIIMIQSARRDSDGNIVSDGGQEDADMKLVTSQVTRGDLTVEFSTYFSRREIVPLNP